MRASSADSPILFLSPEAPFPLTGGGQMRTASLLTFLAERGRVHLTTFAEEGEPNPEAALPRGLVERVTTIYLPYHSRDMLSRVRRNAGRMLRRRLPLMDRFGQAPSLRRVDLATRSQRYSLAVVEHFWCAGYLDLLRSRADRVVLDLHNIESELHGGCARTEPWPHRLGHRLFTGRARQLERRLFGRFDLVLTASDEDAARVRRLCPRARVAVYPNSIPLRPQPRVAERETAAFSGNMEYHPNVTAVRYFHSRIWPILRAKQPALRWTLIGKNDSIVKNIVGDDPRIEVTGAVEDAVLELAKAKIVVVPLLAGSGTRVKIMEAWAAGRAVISTAIGAEGLPARDGENLLLAETPEQWVEQAMKLLSDDDLRRRLGAEGRREYERSCCWPAAWRAIEGPIETLLSHDRAPKAVQ